MRVSFYLSTVRRVKDVHLLIKFFLMDEQTDTLKTLCLGMCGIDFYSRVSTLTPDIDIVTMAD